MSERVFGPYPAVVLSIHDGDTLRLSLDLGFDLSFAINARVYGINAPELSTSEGKAALAYVQTLVKPGDKLDALSHGWDKYGGRFDATLTLQDGRELGVAMIAAGQAKPFMV